MIRITKSQMDNETATLRVEGQLTEGTASELTTAAILVSPVRLRLDLSGVTFADQAGAALVRGFIAKGAELESCSGFMEELLDAATDRPTLCESDLLTRLRAGDQAAFEEIVRSFGGRMLSVARRFLTNEDDARDAVQEAFLSAFQSIHQFNGGAMLSTWLHRIVVNAALMQLRRRRRKPEHSIDELLPRFDAEGSWAHDCTVTGDRPEAMLERHQTREMVRRCIDKLPDSYRAILLLRDIEDLDAIETAARLGVTTSAVKVRLHRARQALRTLIQRETKQQEVSRLAASDETCRASAA